MNLVFQKDFNRNMNDEMEELSTICKDLKIDFYPIVIVPFEHTVVNDQAISNLEGHTIIYGSNVTEGLKDTYGFNPGWFHIDHDEKSVRKFFGDNYINNDMIVCNTENYLDEIKNNGLYDIEYYFMKPNDAKYFPGTIVDKKMMPFVIQSQGKHFGTPEVYDLCIAPVKHIQAEWRFFVVNEELVTGSKYHAENLRLDVQPGYEPEAANFAEKMIKMFPFRTFVIDIAKMHDNMFKVVEINCLNSSGFYKIDKRKLLIALKGSLG